MEKEQITIGTQKFEIKDKLTLILGKIKEEDLVSFRDENLINLIKNIDPLPIESIIKNLKSIYPKIEKSKNLLKFLKNNLKSIELNADIISKFSDLSQKIIQSFQFLNLKNQKIKLNKELEFSKKLNQSSEIEAISDLLGKLSESLKHNKTNLNYLEKDYQKKKNQIGKVNKEIQDINDFLKNLTNQKKLCFRYINNITRNMDGSSSKKNEADINSLLKIDPELSNAEKIRTLQIKAREIQHEINKCKFTLDETHIKYDNLSPQFNIINNDYDKLVNLIQEDENKIKKKEIELKEMISRVDSTLNEQMDNIDFRTNQTPSQIESSLSDLELKMQTILSSETFVYDNSVIKLEEIKDAITDLINFSKKNKNRITISDADKKFTDTFEGYYSLESSVSKLEELLNLFLIEINIRVNLEISITEGYSKLLIHPQFARNKTSNLHFEELTTPEKIFFVIIMQIAIKMMYSKTIIFTNAFIPDSYNKRGSVFRTIRKINQSFEKNSFFDDYNFIFIISNLELKNQIENIKIIKINESEK